LGVALMGALIADGSVTGGDGRHDIDAAVDDRLSARGKDVDYRLSERGAARLERFGVQVGGTRALRYCVDWSEQAHHLSGAVGRALASRLLELGWVRRADRSRALHVTDAGREGFAAEFGLT
jgi:hypothetical protein